MATTTQVLQINKKRSGFSAAQKELVKQHQKNLGVVITKEADDDAPEYVYIECDKEKRKAQSFAAKAAKAQAVQLKPATPKQSNDAFDGHGWKTYYDHGKEWFGVPPEGAVFVKP